MRRTGPRAATQIAWRQFQAMLQYNPPIRSRKSGRPESPSAWFRRRARCGGPQGRDISRLQDIPLRFPRRCRPSGGSARREISALTKLGIDPRSKTLYIANRREGPRFRTEVIVALLPLMSTQEMGALQCGAHECWTRLSRFSECRTVRSGTGIPILQRSRRRHPIDAAITAREAHFIDGVRRGLDCAGSALGKAR